MAFEQNVDTIIILCNFVERNRVFLCYVEKMRYVLVKRGGERICGDFRLTRGRKYDLWGYCWTKIYIESNIFIQT